MATVNPTYAPESGEPGVAKFTYALTTANADGKPVKLPQHTDFCLHGIGTNWGGATLSLEGSNDGTNFVILLNAFTGNAASMTADGIITGGQRPLWVRPNLSTAGAAAVVSAILVMRKNVNATR